MNCATSLGLLSDFHDGLLNEADYEQVRLHLISCRPCDEVFQELEIIVTIAAELRESSDVPFTQGANIWQRLNWNKREIH